MAAKKVEQHEQWLSRGHNFDDNDLERWASATILNAYNSNDTVRSVTHRPKKFYAIRTIKFVPIEKPVHIYILLGLLVNHFVSLTLFNRFLHSKIIRMLPGVMCCRFLS